MAALPPPLSIWSADTELVPRPSIIPRHDDSNGWWATLPPPPPAKHLNGNHRVQTAIVGAGICGIAVAHRLGQLCPGDGIALIEAERAGFGASGRNAGFMLNVHSHGPPKRTDILRRNMQLWESGLSDLRRMACEFQIDCDWHEFGRIYGSAGPDGEKHIDEIAETLDQLGLVHDWMTGDAMEARIGTRFYRRGLYTTGSALVNPAALMRGLARRLPTNVSLFEETPVVEFKTEGDAFIVETETGRVLADRLVMAAGVFLRQFGIAAGRYISMATYASLTDPLSDAELALLGTNEPFGLLASSEYGATIRLTNDKRLFFRNLFEFSPNAPTPAPRVTQISKLHRNGMLNRWPELKKTRFAHCWGGTIAFTWNDGAIFGEYAPGLYAVLTNDVSPMTRAAASGRLLADLMEGEESDLLSLQLGIPGASRLPPRPFLDIGIAIRRRLLQVAARKEF